MVGRTRLLEDLPSGCLVLFKESLEEMLRFHNLHENSRRETGLRRVRRYKR